MMGWLIAGHVFMAWFCAYLKLRKERQVFPGENHKFGYLMFSWCLLGMWLVVPEAWDHSWMDKYKQEEKE